VREGATWLWGRRKETTLPSNFGGPIPLPVYV
jgi:hypothetical protein